MLHLLGDLRSVWISAWGPLGPAEQGSSLLVSSRWSLHSADLNTGFVFDRLSRPSLLYCECDPFHVGFSTNPETKASG